MKKTSFTLILIFVLRQVFAQDYDHIIYKQDFDQVYSTVFDSINYKKALKQWNKLSDKYHNLHTEEYMLQAFCYNQLGKKNKAAKCVKEAWSHQLCDPAYLKQINDFKWLEMVQSFNKKQTKKVEEGYAINTSLNSKDYDSLSYLIENLSNSDQIYRTGSLTQEERLKYKDSLIALAVKRDSLDMVEFLRIYDKWGFPGEKVSVIFSERLLVFMLHFADYDWFYTKMYPLFEEDVRRGRMPASLFLMWIDRHSHSNNQPAEYAMYVNPKQFKATPEELEVIKSKRFEKGVSKLFRIPFELSSN